MHFLHLRSASPVPFVSPTPAQSNPSLSPSGVPKFYRFISERYPLINTKITPGSTPRIDYLYLDMNGIIHNCARGSAGNGGLDSKRYATSAPVVKTPTQIFLDVCKYIDNLFALVPPSKVLYMAIDGVAPRAKMNQQRARRFRSAKERADEHQRLTDEDPMYAAAALEPFDSNCITPGTEFMQKLSTALRYYVAKKVSEDRQWANIEVVLSGAESPGEGEHKIMEYIRAMRESGRFKANTRHCVYGLDADLIMLGLVTHEPHFFILREKVDYTFWKKKGGPRVATSLDTAVFGDFEFLSIGVLREYLALELGAFGNSGLPFFDIERIADDFVFILMLIGNDFLPNLPTLDIADGTLNVMLHLYKRAMPIMGGYLTESGRIIPERLEFFLAKLGMLEKSVMRGKLEAEEQARRGRRRSHRNTAMQNVDLDELFGFMQWQGQTHSVMPGSLSLKELRHEATSIRMKVQDPDLVQLKSSYYAQKLGQDFGTEGSSGLNDLTQSYVEGIWWTLRYYTEGCRQWRWFYPFHYAPFASDISDVAAKLALYEQTRFVADKPFRPLDQLLSVLPPVSSWCLPKPYRTLMTSASSPIHDQYPADFVTDLNGKRNDWEAVVLLPFVDEERLLRAIASVPIKALTSEEIKRNNHGPSYVYKVSADWHEEQVSPFGSQLPSFVSRAKRTKLVLPKIAAGQPFSSKTLPGTLLPDGDETLQDLPYLGAFRHSARLDAVGVNVFGTPSRSESVLITIDFHSDKDAGVASNKTFKGSGNLALAEQQGLSVNGPVWFGYPWRTAGFVEFIANSSVTKRLASGQETKIAANGAIDISTKQTNKSSFARDVGIVMSTLLQKNGVVLSAPQEIVGVRTDHVGGPSKAQDNNESSVALCDTHFVRRRVVTNSPCPNGEVVDLPLSQGQTVLYVGSGPYFGQKGTVRSRFGHGMVKVEFTVAATAAREPAFGYRVVSISSSQRWLTLSRLASAVGIPVPVVDVVLGSVRVRLQSAKEEIDLGLGIKYIGRGLYIPGYARRDERQYYSFSEKTADLLRRYRTAFPHLFSTIEKCRMEEAKAANGRPRGNNVYSTRDLFGNTKKADDAARAASTWISVQEVARLPLVSADSHVLPMETVAELQKHQSIILALQKEYENTLGRMDVSKKTKDITRQSLLTGSEGLSWSFESGNPGFPANAPVAPDGSGLRLGDRVVNRIGIGGVPFGLRGTVVGIHPLAAVPESPAASAGADSAACALVEVVFDEGFIGGSSLSGRCSPGRGKAVPAYSLFIVRPDRENQFYVKNYARMAAKTAVTTKRNGGGSASRDARSEAIAKASVLSYAGAVRKKAVGSQPAKLAAEAPTFVPAAYGPLESGPVVGPVETKMTHTVNAALLPVPTFVNGNRKESGKKDKVKPPARAAGSRKPKSGAVRVGRPVAMGAKEEGSDEASRVAAHLTEMLKQDLGIASELAAEEALGREVVAETVNGQAEMLTPGGNEKDDLLVMWEQLQKEETKQRASLG